MVSLLSKFQSTQKTTFLEEMSDKEDASRSSDDEDFQPGFVASFREWLVIPSMTEPVFVK